MNSASFFVLGVLPYLAVVVFAAGMINRFYTWFKTPQPGKMTLFPAGGSATGGVLAETFFFPSLFRGDRVLWFFAWVFHATLALVFLGHIRVFTGLIDRVLMSIGVSPEGIDAMSSTLGGAAGVVLLATGLLLLFRRIVQQRTREISNFSDFFALLLLIAIIFTGDLMRFGTHFELAETRAWARSLVTFSPIVVNNGMFQVHALLAMVLIIYVPFSKIMHFGGIFFTQALIKRR
ncbi:MAG: respiratory nitrate reductase subunit gamma [Candidatus Latescibacterota bacterium]|nr:MAG: respiratory nitrate reductase subunit gamma [Candidatus Latescibacterota bacterium]